MRKSFFWAGLVTLGLFFVLGAGAAPAQTAVADPAPTCDDHPNLIYRFTQAQVTSGLSLTRLRREGRRIFTTPFNKLDGFGEDYDPAVLDHTTPGNRPTLQNNGTFLRVNGLDAQACVECHGVANNSSIPPIFGVGGVGGISASPMPDTKNIDPDDSQNLGYAETDGRVINPPFVFGSGGVELVAREMTADLEAIRLQAIANPNVIYPLYSKGVNFGTVVSHDGVHIDVTNVVGVNIIEEETLTDTFLHPVVSPFGRKGSAFTTRDFDRGATRFHQGMEPVEVVGAGVDGDGDNVRDELLIGEMSVLHIFQATNPKPEFVPMSGAAEGLQQFQSIGCAECHIPTQVTDSDFLDFSQPEVAWDPTANVFASVDLRQAPMNFQDVGPGGVAVDMFSDLKRHDMGPDLEESTGGPLDPLFITARLWGAADTAPYIHDGRSQTLKTAILAHGGDALTARNNFDGLACKPQAQLLAFLRSLRTPVNPNDDLGPSIPNVNN